MKPEDIKAGHVYEGKGRLRKGSNRRLRRVLQIGEGAERGLNVFLTYDLPLQDGQYLAQCSLIEFASWAEKEVITG